MAEDQIIIKQVPPVMKNTSEKSARGNLCKLHALIPVFNFFSANFESNYETLASRIQFTPQNLIHLI